MPSRWFSTPVAIQSNAGVDGAIATGESTTLTFPMSFTRNFAASYGGAVYSGFRTGSSTTITDCTFADNAAGSWASAVDSNGSFTLTGSDFTANSANRGGAISNNGNSGIWAISGSSFDQNTATNGCGAALVVNSVTLTLTQSTFTNNHASGGVTGPGLCGGGALSSFPADTTRLNVTFTGNVCDNCNSNGEQQYRGSAPNAAVALNNVTVSGNSNVLGTGGGVSFGTANIVLTNSIIAARQARPMPIVG